MSDRWCRIETLLPVVPAILVISLLIFCPGRTMDFQFYDTMLVIAVIWILIAVFLLQFVYFLLHGALRTRGRENDNITRAHVMGSTAGLLLMIVPVLFLGNPVRADTAQKYIGIVLLRQKLNPVVSISALVCLLLQAFILVYLL